MVFNAAMGNVDDHLKNFWMLASPDGYRLAPAFDLVPDLAGRGEHTLAFHVGFTCPSQADLVALARAWHVREAPTLIRQVTKAVSCFAATARRLKVRRGKSIDGIGRDIDRRLAILNT